MSGLILQGQFLMSAAGSRDFTSGRVMRSTLQVNKGNSNFFVKQLESSNARLGIRCGAFFKNPFRETSEEAGIYGSQGRDDYSADDVEHYFNYMGMLAIEGTYERLYKMMETGLEPVDLLLLMAAGEDDAPKVAELLRAGANLKVQDAEGRTARQLTKSEAVIALLDNPASAFSF
eukprot:jgi/Botrbrau1/19641/Bobra.0003s0011.1